MGCKIFHLMTHAAFKALLFRHGSWFVQQNIFKMVVWCPHPLSGKRRSISRYCRHCGLQCKDEILAGAMV